VYDIGGIDVSGAAARWFIYVKMGS